MSDHTERHAMDSYEALLAEQIHGRRAGGTAHQHTFKTAAPPVDSEENSVDIVVHRDLRPPFLVTAAVGSFSRQLNVVVPVTSASASLVKSAEAGSKALLEFKREEARAKIARDNTDMTKSDLFRLVNANGAPSEVGGVAATDAEEEERELESIKRKIRLIEEASSAAGSGGQALRKAVPSSDLLTTTSIKASSTLSAKQERRTAIELAAAQHSTRDVDPDGFAAIQATRRSLPIYRCRSELLRYIGENPVSIVMGETGSGKTTQLVQYLYESGYASKGRIIGCTQPRRLAAIGVATRVATEIGCVLGSTVGYSIHLDDMTTDQTKVRFMTDGVLLREIVHDPDVDKYSVLILDEAHERSIDTDVLLGVLKGVCRRRSDLKVIVTSATLNVLKFSSFFDNAPYYEIPGKTFEVDVHYASEPVDDYVHEAVLKAVEIHLRVTIDQEAAAKKKVEDTEAAKSMIDHANYGRGGGGGFYSNGGDILIFMTGRDDVFGTCSMIHRLLHSRPKRQDGTAWEDTLLLIPLLSEAVSGNQRILFDPAPQGKRKCIVATNVAETSLTIDGIRFVIDCGMMKTNVYHPTFGMNTLRRYPTSQAQSNQRKGRAGRTAAGVCHRLFTKLQFEKEMLPSAIPEIQRSSVDTVVLLLKSIAVDNLNNFDFIDAPPEVNLRNSMWQLWLFGALDQNGVITDSGRLMLEFPVTPTLTNILIHSSRLGCSEEILTIISMLSADPKALFECPAGKEDEARRTHGRFYNGDSDHLTLLNVYEQYHSNGKNHRWAREQFLHMGTLERASHVRLQLVEKMTRLQLPIVAAGLGNTDRVRRCLVHGYCLQAAKRASGKWTEYTPLLCAGVTATLMPTASVASAGSTPEYVVYDDLMFTAKEYLVTVTAVDPRWLVDVGRGLYTIKGEAYDPSIAAAEAPVMIASAISSATGRAKSVVTSAAAQASASWHSGKLAATNAFDSFLSASSESLSTSADVVNPQRNEQHRGTSSSMSSSSPFSVSTTHPASPTPPSVAAAKKAPPNPTVDPLRAMLGARKRPNL